MRSSVAVTSPISFFFLSSLSSGDLSGDLPVFPQPDSIKPTPTTVDVRKNVRRPFSMCINIILSHVQLLGACVKRQSFIMLWAGRVLSDFPMDHRSYSAQSLASYPYSTSSQMI